jgi:hypothetical protein
MTYYMIVVAMTGKTAMFAWSDENFRTALIKRFARYPRYYAVITYETNETNVSY